MRTFHSQHGPGGYVKAETRLDHEGDLYLYSGTPEGREGVFLRRPEVAALRDHLTAVLGDAPRYPEALTLAERENARGSEARAVVYEVARRLGVRLADDPRDGEVFSPANMARVIEALAARLTADPVLDDIDRTIRRAVAREAEKVAAERIAALREQIAGLMREVDR